MDALTRTSDEGRSMVAIRFGEVPSNLRSGDVLMGKPARFGEHSVTLGRERTQGSKTFQYLEEKKTIVIA